MYESFYNFKAEPFRLSPDHRFCFTHKSYAKAKAYMQYAIHRAEGFVMVTGKPGTGKTTLVNDLVDGLSQSKMVVATIVSTQLEADDLLRLVSYNFGLDVEAPNKAVVLQGLSVRLRRHHEEGTRALLIIDEAQDLSASALEELRLLTNLQLNNQPLLQIFLVGQESLRDLVQKPSMEQVHQRLVAACHLESLNEEDTKAYIHHRLDRVGWKDDPIIDQGVFSLVYQFSKGVPRRINLICSRFLLHGSVEEKHRIRASDVRTVVDELQHEQLTPVGFKEQLPPLLDEEEDQISPDSALITSVTSATDDQLSSGQQMDQDQDVAIQTMAGSEASPLQADAPLPEKDSLDVASLEAQVRREESGSQVKNDTITNDVIQQNYFSLDDAMEGSSEPVPIQKPSAVAGSEHGYGDRFVSAQRERQEQHSRTHYYSEYQADDGDQPAASKKRGMLGLVFVFVLILGVVLAAIYMIRPQILQSEISYLEENVTHYLNLAVGRENQTRDQSPANPGQVAGELGNDKPKQADRQQAPGDVAETEPDEVLADPDATDKPRATAPLSETGRVLPTDMVAGIQPGDPESISDRTDPVDETVSMVDRPVVSLPAAEVLPKKKLSPLTGGELISTLPDAPSTSSLPKAGAPVELVGPIARTEGARSDSINETISDTASVFDPVTEVGDQSLDSVDPIKPESEPERVLGVVSSQPPVNRTLVEEAERRGGGTGTGSAPLSLASIKPPRKPGLKKAAETPNSLGEDEAIRIFFNRDSSDIASADQQKLDRIVERLSQYPGRIAQVVGYADSTGDAAYNLSLSFKRARVVADYLKKQGISGSQLQVEGRGVYPESLTGDEIQSQSERSHRLVRVDILRSGD